MHQRVGYAHDLSEHVAWFVCHADVVALGLAHFFRAVESDEDRHDHDDLRFLPGCLLEVSSDEVVERLVGAPEFDVGFDADAVVSLHDRV